MSTLDELMVQLCPEGVEYKTLGEIADIGTGSSNGNEAVDDGEFPFFIRSQTVKRKNTMRKLLLFPGKAVLVTYFTT